MCPIPPRGVERGKETTNNTTVSDRGGAESGARRAGDGRIDPVLAALADALTDLPESDRPAVVAHVAALARLGPGKRTAILTLTDSIEGENET